MSVFFFTPVLVIQNPKEPNDQKSINFYKYIDFFISTKEKTHIFSYFYFLSKICTALGDDNDDSALLDALLEGIIDLLCEKYILLL